MYNVALFRRNDTAMNDASRYEVGEYATGCRYCEINRDWLKALIKYHTLER